MIYILGNRDILLSPMVYKLIDNMVVYGILAVTYFSSYLSLFGPGRSLNFCSVRRIAATKTSSPIPNRQANNPSTYTTITTNRPMASIWITTPKSYTCVRFWDEQSNETRERERGREGIIPTVVYKSFTCMNFNLVGWSLRRQTKCPRTIVHSNWTFQWLENDIPS